MTKEGPGLALEEPTGSGGTKITTAWPIFPLPDKLTSLQSLCILSVSSQSVCGRVAVPIL